MRNAIIERLAPIALVACGVSLSFGGAPVEPSPAAVRIAAAAASEAPPASEAFAPRAPPEVAAAGLHQALETARRGGIGEALRLRDRLPDPVARKIVDWAVVDLTGDQMPPDALRGAIERFRDWPRGEARDAALVQAERPGPTPYAALSREDMAAAAYRARRLQMIDALRRGDSRGAYAAMARHGLAPGGVYYAEAEFFAGWLSLRKLRDAGLAEEHFARLDAAVKSPVSKARAAYWRGRAAEAAGKAELARRFYDAGLAYPTTFYGQLAAEKAGRRDIQLAPDPTPTPAERAEFERAELTRAIRLLAAADERRLVRVFALHFGGQVRSRTELALLVDALKGLGEQEVSLLAYRRGAQQGLILHERGYPTMRAPAAPGGAEPALVLAVTRQESQFDPRVRSSADARGMMQVLPSTGRRMARELGLGWSDQLLWDVQANMRMGSRYLGQLAQENGGSYVLAAVGYNAGPRRPAAWIQSCGDPRAPGADPLDFIECIPFDETRNYVMNVMANYQVYRARLNGGRSTLTAAESLRVVRAGART